MSAYLAVWKLRLINGLQYRAAALAGILTQLFFGFVFIMVYIAFYGHAGSAAGSPAISLQGLVDYTWLQQIFLGFIALWYRDPDLFQLITSGNIAYELCRPCGIYPYWYAKLLGVRLSAVALRCLPLLLVVFVLPRPYRLSLPPSLLQLLLFAASLLLGLFLVVAISMLIYISVFWTLSPQGSLLMIAVLGEFFSGMILPIPLMPDWLQRGMDVLPFRWTVDFPFRVYSGQIPAAEACWGLLAQLAWLSALAGFGVWWMNRALRQLVVQGG